MELSVSVIDFYAVNVTGLSTKQSADWKLNVCARLAMLTQSNHGWGTVV